MLSDIMDIRLELEGYKFFFPKLLQSFVMPSQCKKVQVYNYNNNKKKIKHPLTVSLRH